MNQLVEFLQTEIRPYFASHERKSLRQQWRETRELWARYRCVPYHYLKHRLYERSASPDFLDYVPAKLMQRFRFDRNPRSRVSMLNDKLETIRVLAGTGVRCASRRCSASAPVGPSLEATVRQCGRTRRPRSCADLVERYS